MNANRFAVLARRATGLASRCGLVGLSLAGFISAGQCRLAAHVRDCDGDGQLEDLLVDAGHCGACGRDCADVGDANVCVDGNCCFAPESATYRNTGRAAPAPGVAT